MTVDIINDVLSIVPNTFTELYAIETFIKTTGDDLLKYCVIDKSSLVIGDVYD